MRGGEIMKPCSCDSGCACGGCCLGTEPSTPQTIANRPGLDALAYRIGTHSSFVETMKARLSSGNLPGLAGLTTRETNDPAIALLDAWGVVADVLTFYQERIANEGYLRTATERRSVLELARLVGYAPRPGVAASTYLAYTLDPGPETVIPAGARAQSVPGPGEMPQSFEISEDLTARASWNHLPVRRTRPQQPEILKADPPFALYFKGIATQLKPNDPLLIETFPNSVPKLYRTLKVEPVAAADRTRVEVEPWVEDQNPFALSSEKAASAAVPGALGTGPSAKVTSVPKVLESLGKRPTVQPNGGRRLERDAGALLAPGSDLAARLVTVARPELREVFYQTLANVPVTPAPTLRVWGLRAKASVFGHNAPLELTRTEDSNQKVTFSSEEWKNLAETEQEVWLDAAYPQILPASWIVLLRPNPIGEIPERVITRVVKAGESSRATYGISAKATRVALEDRWLELNEKNVENFAVIRGTAVFAQPEELTLAEAPIEEPLCGQEIELAGLYDSLSPGRWLIASGERTDVTGVGEGEDQDEKVSVPGIAAAELVMIAGVHQGVAQRKTTETAAAVDLPGERTHTTLTLATPLAYCYKRDTFTLYGNVAHATQGETRFEVLGSGESAQAFQTFALKQPPLTHVSAPTPSGIESTLGVRVNDVLWHEAPSLAGLGPADRSYTLRTDDGGQTTVIFGNGEQGARLPTGRENVRAVYRSGIGKAGNVKADQISQLATRPLGVRGVTNPLPASGGADRESRDQARKNAPLALMALDRLISVQDYEDFARTFAGVGKASAVRLPDGRVQLVHVTIAGEDDVPILADSDTFRNLDAALRRFGDPRQPLRLELREASFLFLEAKVRLLPDFDWEKVEPKIRAALLDTFGFVRRSLGQDARLSEVYATIQGIRGVDFAEVDLFDTVAGSVDADELKKQVAKLGKDQPKPRLPARPAGADEKGTIEPAQILYLTPEVPDTLILKERK